MIATSRAVKQFFFILQTHPVSLLCPMNVSNHLNEYETKETALNSIWFFKR